MKNLTKHIGIIALAAVIGLSMTALFLTGCNNPASGGGGGGGGTPGGGTPKPPTNIGGNLGNYVFGPNAEGKPNYQFAVWDLPERNLVAKAKTSGAKLVLVLTKEPTAGMVFVWAGLKNELYWQATEILDGDGKVVAGKGATWDPGTKTLTIVIDKAAWTEGGVTYKDQDDLKLAIAYWNDPKIGINELGITNANLE